MSGPTTFYFDYADPLSALMDARLRSVGADATIERTPWVSAPRGTPAWSMTGSDWSDRMSVLREEWPGEPVSWAAPRFVPRTEKALELFLYASSEGLGEAVHRALFQAFFQEGLDLGRIDLLVEVAESAGLDRTATKVTLDVDRFAEPLRELRREGERRGIAGVPTLVSPRGVLNGRVTVQDLRDFIDI